MGILQGPVLFILVANDMPQYMEECCKIIMYADDTALLLANYSPNTFAVESYVRLEMAHKFATLKI